MTVKTILTASALILAISGAAYASRDDGGRQGDNDAICSTATGQWMSLEAAIGKAREKGYQVRGIEKDDGCYEIEAVDGNGVELEFHLHPVSGEIVKSYDKD